MCERKIVIGGRGCQVYGDETAKNVIFWFTGEHEKDTIEEVYQQLNRRLECTAFTMECAGCIWKRRLCRRGSRDLGMAGEGMSSGS